MLARGQYADAELALRSLIETEPRPLVNYLLGYTLIRLYRYADAEVFLRSAVRERPREHAWLHALAKSLLEQGRNRAAIDVLDGAITLAPRPEYHFAKAMCALNIGDSETSEKELRYCLEQNP